MKKERQNLSFVFLIYSGVHLISPCVFCLRTPRRLVIRVDRKRTVQSFPDLVIIKRSMSEFSVDSPIARELQRATRSTDGSFHKNHKAILWRKLLNNRILFSVIFSSICYLVGYAIGSEEGGSGKIPRISQPITSSSSRTSFIPRSVFLPGRGHNAGSQERSPVSL
jgi:hypothetical protein